MEQLNEFLQALVASASHELCLEPNKRPYVVSAEGSAEIGSDVIQGTQISMMVFPLIPADIKQELPGKSEVEFIHPHKLGRFSFRVRKSPAGFIVSVTPFGAPPRSEEVGHSAPFEPASAPSPAIEPMTSGVKSAYESETISFGTSTESPSPVEFEPSSTNAAPSASEPEAAPIEFEPLIPEIPPISFEPSAPDAPAAESPVPSFESLDAELRDPAPSDFRFETSGFIPPAEEYIPEPEAPEPVELPPVLPAEPLTERRTSERRGSNFIASDKVTDLLQKAIQSNGSAIFLSPAVGPQIEIIGRTEPFGTFSDDTDAAAIREMIYAVMPADRIAQLEQTGTSRFTVRLASGALFSCTAFAELGGISAAFTYLNPKVPTANDLGFPPELLDATKATDGLIIVGGKDSNGRARLLAAVIDTINNTRAARMTVVDDQICFYHANGRCVISQREIGVHAVSHAEAIAAAAASHANVIALNDLPDRATAELAVQTASSGTLVIAGIASGKAASAVASALANFPSESQQTRRCSLQESLRGIVIANHEGEPAEVITGSSLNSLF